MQLQNITFGIANLEPTPKMTTGWFKLMLNVTYLELHAINIVEVEDNAFSCLSFQTLTYLIFRDVPLRALRKGTFFGLKSLKMLSFKNARFENIQKNALAAMPNLASFMMRYCGERKILLGNLFGFSKMPHLTRITIINCNLNDTIRDTTFTGLQALSHLALNFNHIKTIAPKAFQNVFKTLNKLYMDDNMLKSIPKSLFKTDRILKIYVQRNPWHCDCKMEYLRSITERAKSLKIIGIICNTPAKYHGFALVECPPLCDEQRSASIYTAENNSTEMHTAEMAHSTTEPTLEFPDLEELTESPESIGNRIISNHFCILYVLLWFSFVI